MADENKIKLFLNFVIPSAAATETTVAVQIGYTLIKYPNAIPPNAI